MRESFCYFLVGLDGAPFVIEDAITDPRTATHPPCFRRCQPAVRPGRPGGILAEHSGDWASDDTALLALRVPLWPPPVTAVLAGLMTTVPAGTFMMLFTVTTVVLTVVGTAASALWFFTVLRKAGIRLRFAPA